MDCVNRRESGLDSESHVSILGSAAFGNAAPPRFELMRWIHAGDTDRVDRTHLIESAGRWG